MTGGTRSAQPSSWKGLLRPHGEKVTLPLVADASHGLGDVLFSRQDWNAAERLYRESFLLTFELKNSRGCLYCLRALAAVAAEQGQVERAGLLWGAAEAHERESGLHAPHTRLRDVQDRCRQSCERSLRASGGRRDADDARRSSRLRSDSRASQPVGRPASPGRVTRQSSTSRKPGPVCSRLTSRGGPAELLSVDQ